MEPANSESNNVLHSTQSEKYSPPKMKRDTDTFHNVGGTDEEYLKKLVNGKGGRQTIVLKSQKPLWSQQNSIVSVDNLSTAIRKREKSSYIRIKNENKFCQDDKISDVDDISNSDESSLENVINPPRSELSVENEKTYQKPLLPLTSVKEEGDEEGVQISAESLTETAIERNKCYSTDTSVHEEKASVGNIVATHEAIGATNGPRIRLKNKHAIRNKVRKLWMRANINQYEYQEQLDEVEGMLMSGFISILISKLIMCLL